MEWAGLGILSSPQVDFTHFFSLPRKYFWKTPRFDAIFAVWLPSSIFSLSPLILKLLAPNPCVACEEFSPVLDFLEKVSWTPLQFLKFVGPI